MKTTRSQSAVDVGTTRAAAASFASSGKLSLYTEFDVNEARTEVISFEPQ